MVRSLLSRYPLSPTVVYELIGVGVISARSAKIDNDIRESRHVDRSLIVALANPGEMARRECIALIDDEIVG